MVTTITVQPVENGWIVVSPDRESPLRFASGAQAEIAARRMAERQSAEGKSTEIRIHLRDGSLGARFVCAPKAPPRVIWGDSNALGIEAAMA